MSPSFAENERVMARIRADESAPLGNLDKSLLGSTKRRKHKVRVGIIYYIKAPSGKGYVGQTKQMLCSRMAQHRNKSKCPRLAAAIRKYGWSQMHVEELCRVPVDELDKEECRYIKELGTMHPKGYNLTSGGKEGPDFEVSDEVRDGISIRKKREWTERRKWFMEKLHGEATKQKINASLKAKQSARLSGMDAHSREKAERRIESEKIHSRRALEKRRASRDPVAWDAWNAENAKMTTDERKSHAMAIKRAEKMAAMNPVDAALWMHKVRRSAIHMASKRGVPFESLERWYPNVLTMQEIRALQGNGGAWPIPASC